MTMKRALVAATFMLPTLGQAQVAYEKPESIACEVTELNNENRNFFHSAGGVPLAPIVGDTITLTVTSDKLNALDFDSGHTIPLARFGTELDLIREATFDYVTVYAGKHQGILSAYEGVVVLLHSSEATTVEIKIQKGVVTPQEYRLKMDCTNVKKEEAEASY